MKKVVTLSLFILCLLAANIVLLCPVSSESSEMKIYVSPQEITANSGDSFDASVRIEDGFDVWSFQLYLAWDKDILEATEVVEGDFPSSGGFRTTDPMAKIYNDEGYVFFSNTLVGTPREGEDGSGTFVTITFLVKSAGITGLHIYRFDCANADQDPLHYTLEDGYVNTVAPKISVDPSIIINGTLLMDESFSVNINISNVEELKEYFLKLGYDKTLLNVTDVSAAPFLEEPSTNQTGVEYDEGYAWILARSTAAGSVNGSGILANVTFTVLKNGSCILDLYDAWLDDKLKRLRPSPRHNAIGEDGYFSNIPVGHDIAVKKITVLPISVTAGESISVNVTISNIGDYPETFNVILYYDSEVIENRSSISLDPREEVIEAFTWDTTGVAPGSYFLEAEASVVEGEIETDNNVKKFPNAIDIKGAEGSNFMLYAGIGIAVAVIAVIAVVYFLKIRKPK